MAREEKETIMIKTFQRIDDPHYLTRVRDNVETVEALPSENMYGDIRKVEADSCFYIWHNDAWDNMSGVVDLSNYYTKTETNNNFYTKSYINSNYYTITQISTNFYNKTQTDEELEKKVNVSDYNTKVAELTNSINTKQAILTSANAGDNITITSEAGVVKISSTGGGGGGVTDAYTKAESDARFGLKTKEHTHDNMAVLNGLSVSGDGQTLLFNNKPCGTVATKVFNNTYTGSNVSETLVLNTNTIITEQGIDSVYNQELTIKNMGTDNLTLRIVQDDIDLMNLTLEADASQSYLMNHSTELKIYVKGSYKLIYDLIGF